MFVGLLELGVECLNKYKNVKNDDYDDASFEMGNTLEKLSDIKNKIALKKRSSNPIENK